MEQQNVHMKKRVVGATPVNLYGILEDVKPVKRKTFGEGSDMLWPPRRSRAFREVSTNQSTGAFCVLQTTPAAVKAIAEKENASGKLERLHEDSGTHM